MTNKLPNICISDFAEELILQDIGESKDLPLMHPDLDQNISEPDQIDISNITVSDDFISQVTGKKTSINESKVVKDSETKLENLVGRLSGLIKEAKEILSELAVGIGTTTVGRIGVNMAGPENKSKKKKKKKKEKSYLDEETLKIIQKLI